MQFELTEEQRQFADALRRWAERGYTFEHRQKAVRNGGRDATDWAVLAEMGLVALGVPQDQGGLEGGGIEHLVAMQQMGRSLLAEPLFATLWGTAFLRIAGGREALLARVAAGELRLACALPDVAGRDEQDDAPCVFVPCDAGWRLSGRHRAVLHGAQADMLIVSARVPGHAMGDAAGTALFVVAADAVGLERVDYPTFDGLRAATVTLDDVVVPPEGLLATPGRGWDVRDAAVDFGVALLCAEAIGLLEVMVEDTLEHLRNRQQFGQPIGRFQALQHRMAEMFIHLEQARSMAWLAATHVSSPEPEQRRRCVSAAKVRIGAALRFVGQQAVQLHGGLGVCDEARITHSFRRATAIELSLGDTDHHLARFAAQPGFAPR